MIVIIAGISLVYNTVPDLTSKNDLLKDEVATLQKNIQRSGALRLKRALANNKKILLQKREEFRKLKEQTTFVLSELYSLKFAFFDEKEWINTLDKILKKSVGYDIEIQYVKNSDIDKPTQNFSLIKKKKNIQIEAIGSFANILKYISYIEQLPSLLRFETIKFGLQNGKVKALMVFDTYGIGI
jgi:hypothetical protein